MNISDGVLSTDTQVVTLNTTLRGDGFMGLNTFANTDPLASLKATHGLATANTGADLLSARGRITQRTPIISGNIILF